MHIQFISVKLKRFRSFLEESTLFFDSSGSGLYFLKGKNQEQKALGSNGAGKSSLVDALLWCLYGRTVQGLKNPDITPWTGKGQTFVEVTVKIGDKSHVIRRTVGPNLLTVDGKEVGQDYIAKFIPIPLEVIPYTIVLGQRQPLFYDLTASEKLKLFSETLNLDRWEARSAHAAEIVKSLTNEISTKERERELLDQRLVETKQDIESIKAKSDLWENQRSSALETRDKERKQHEFKLAPLHKQRDDADLKLDQAETELRAINLTELNRQRRAQESAHRSYENDFIRESASYQQIVEQLAALAKSKCPTCGQPMTDHKKLKGQLEARIKTTKDLVTGFKTGADDALKKLIAFDKAIKIQEEASLVFRQNADSARDVLDQILPDIAKAEAAIKQIDRACEEYEKQDNPYKEQIITIRKRAKQYEVDIQKIAESVESKTAHCERMRYWVKGFKDIKLYTLEEILQELDITTNGMLDQFGLLGWKISYDVERETKAGTIARGLNITVLSPNNSKTVKWEVWSGGESQRLRLLGTAALSTVLLNHLGVSTNIEVYDEPTESLSKEGVEDLVELLAYRAKDTKKALWLVDHHTIESSQFIDVVTIIKDKSGSQICLGI